jgi:hypothetical protein
VTDRLRQSAKAARGTAGQHRYAGEFKRFH